MSSIFDLKTSPSQLVSSNNGTSRMQYEQLPPTRDVTANNFSNGAIHFRFETSGQKWWIPSRSYLRFRCRLTKVGGGQLDTADNIAPNMNLAAALFQSMEFRIADKTISRIADFVPQVDSLQRRLTSSKSTIDSIGASSCFWSPYFDSRQADVCVDGESPTNITRPTVARTRAILGFDEAGGAGNDRNAASLVTATGVVTFAQNGGAVLPADVRTLFPVGSYIRFDTIQGAAANDTRVGVPLRVIEGLTNRTIRVEANVIANVGADGRTDFVRLTQQTLTFSPPARRVREFELTWVPPLSVFKIASALPSGKYELVLNPQTNSIFQKAAIESLGADKVPGTDFVFEIVDMYFYVNTVEGKRADDLTYLLDLDQTRCQTEDISSAAFGQRNFDVSPSTYALTAAFQDLRVNQNTLFSQTRFRAYDTAGNAEVGLNLNRFFISYDGQQLPSPDAAPVFTTLTDYTTQRYIESQLYSGGYFDTGGAETVHEWQTRGQYLYFSWPRDGMSKATRVNVHTGFENATDVSQMRLLLFDHSRQVAKIQIQDGRVVDVLLEDA